jgi:hypothetical protein
VRGYDYFRTGDDSPFQAGGPKLKEQHVKVWGPHRMRQIEPRHFDDVIHSSTAGVEGSSVQVKVCVHL